jgi:XRE family transcriptional regulator, regulator of sulfur utilization
MNLHDPPAIGPRLQAYRKAHNFTLAELAKRSGVSRSMLSEIERGNSNPTYGTLWHLTRALDIDLNSLATGAREETSRHIDHQTENLTPLIRSADRSCALQILSPASMVSIIEWYLLDFEPKGKLLSDPHAAGTTEHLHCTDGQITVRSGASEVVVRAGETARYPADVAHGLINTGATGAKAFLVVAADLFIGTADGALSVRRPK